MTKLKSIRVVELEPAVVDAGKAIRGGKIPALQDSRVKLEFNDARNTLLVEKNKYDIIASQPSHPWLARASNVFTRDFFALVKSRLNKGGIFGQWVNLFHMDATTLKSLMRSFYEVFPYGMTFANIDTGDFLMFGSDSPTLFNYDRIKQRLNEPKIKTILGYYNVYSVKDLLWYFSLSREQAVAVSKQVPANTDTNILSEVRLSIIGKKPPPAEDPYKFLKQTYSFNVRPYLTGDVANRLYSLGTYYLSEWDNEKIAMNCARQLKDIAPVLARSLHYEKYWHRFDFSDAFKLYAEHAEWPDRTHFQQALALSDEGQYQAAMGIVKRLKSKDMRRVLKARLLYKQERYDELAALKPQVDAERMWQLTALARTNLKSAGTRLHALIQRVKPELPQLRVLAGYYGLIHDKVELDKNVRRIVSVQNKQIRRITRLIREAVNGGQKDRAQYLLKRLATYHPEENYNLKLLRKKVNDLPDKPQNKVQDKAQDKAQGESA